MQVVAQRESTLSRLPEYLKPYVVEQKYERYTPQDHAIWRFIMRQSRDFFQKHAHPVYLAGLEKTGIPIDSIPDIQEMDKMLHEFGWGAVCVCGFIPPLVFLDFQARKILPIAADMRTMEHLTYTPAPDIVHEAAGHAPMLADSEFREYLNRYATLARKAIFSREDIKLYEAIRILSDTKENPDYSAKDREEASKGLEKAIANIKWTSEASQVARMNWWTAEYGLVGNLTNPMIYGAGLLSSLKESQLCLDAHVKKIPLSLKCIQQTYDITEPQPQLFVAKDFQHLVDVLQELEETMAYKIGGKIALERAKQAQTLTTTVLNSGLEISGVVHAFELDEQEKFSFIKWSQGVQLAFGEKELSGHSTKRHPDGFSSPIGAWESPTAVSDPSSLYSRELKKCGLEINQVVEIKYKSGFIVKGRLIGIHTREHKPLLLTFAECQVKKGETVYFAPEWGEFDLALGVDIPSVYGGPADLQRYGECDLGKASSTPGRSTSFTEKEKKLHTLYASLKSLRNGSELKDKLLSELEKIASTALQDFPEEWLLGIELCELLSQKIPSVKKSPPSWFSHLKTTLLNPSRYSEDTNRFIKQGVSLAEVMD